MSLATKTYILVAMCCSWTATVASAATMPEGACYLSDLIDGSTTVTSGDKTISDVMYAAVGTMPSPEQIIVTPISDMYGNYGFRFTGPFVDFDDGVSSDAFLEFTVNVTDPNFEIVGLNLMGNPAVLGGNGLASVTETALPQEMTTSLDIFESVPGSFRGMDTATLSTGYSSLRIQKDILLNAGEGSTATLSFFDQTFVQQIVPEPGTMSLLGIALCGLLTSRRRRR